MEHLIEKYSTKTFSRKDYLKKNVDSDNFYTPFINDIVKEVKQQPLRVQKKFYRLLTGVQAFAIPMMAATKAHAQENIDFPLLEKAYGLDILPDEIVTILVQVIIGCGILGVAFAMICLMVAGGYRVMGNRDKASTWSEDIIKGLGQILLAPVIILILVTLTGFMFQNIPGLDIFF